MKIQQALGYTSLQQRKPVVLRAANACMALVIASLAISVQARADVVSGLVAHYSFDDGTATDGSGNNNDGTVEGATSDVGVSGAALSFDGSDYVRIPFDDYFNTGSTITVSAFFRTTSSLNEADALIHHGAFGPGHGQTPDPTTQSWMLYVSGGAQCYVAPIIYLEDNNEYWNSSVYPVDVNDDAWHHIVGTFDRSLSEKRLKFYFDGELFAETNAADSDLNATYTDLYIGADTHGLGYSGYYGLIDEVQVYDRALSATDVQELYCINIPDACAEAVPAVSTWGMAVTALLLLAVATILLRRNPSLAMPLTRGDDEFVARLRI